MIAIGYISKVYSVQIHIPCITYSRDHGETVNGRVDEAPRAAATVRGRAGFESIV